MDQYDRYDDFWLVTPGYNPDNPYQPGPDYKFIDTGIPQGPFNTTLRGVMMPPPRPKPLIIPLPYIAIIASSAIFEILSYLPEASVGPRKRLFLISRILFGVTSGYYATVVPVAFLASLYFSTHHSPVLVVPTSIEPMAWLVNMISSFIFPGVRIWILKRKEQRTESKKFGRPPNPSMISVCDGCYKLHWTTLWYLSTAFAVLLNTEFGPSNTFWAWVGMGINRFCVGGWDLSSERCYVERPSFIPFKFVYFIVAGSAATLIYGLWLVTLQMRDQDTRGILPHKDLQSFGEKKRSQDLDNKDRDPDDLEKQRK